MFRHLGLVCSSLLQGQFRWVMNTCYLLAVDICMTSTWLLRCLPLSRNLLCWAYGSLLGSKASGVGTQEHCTAWPNMTARSA